MKQIHYLVFDGTSHYVTSLEDLEPYVEIVKTSDDLELLSDLADELNNSI